MSRVSSKADSPIAPWDLSTSAARGWLAVCDFDGTIAKIDVTDGILSRFAQPEWEVVEAEWKAGSIGSRECMRRQVELVRAPRAELDAYLDTVEIDPDFAGFVADCRAARVPVVVISDGIDYAIRRILKRHRLGNLPLASNRLAASGETFALDFPYADAGCRAGSGTCKCAVSAARAGDARRLLIGDGTSDFCLAASADLVFAKASLLRHCRELGLAHRPCPDFATARRLLGELVKEMQTTSVRPSAAPVRAWTAAALEI